MAVHEIGWSEVTGRPEVVKTITWGRLKAMLDGMPDDWEVWANTTSHNLMVAAPGDARGTGVDLPMGEVDIGSEEFYWFTGQEGAWRLDDDGKGGP